MVYVYSCVKERVNAAKRSKERGRTVQYGTKNLINFLLFSAKFCNAYMISYEDFVTSFIKCTTIHCLMHVQATC